MDEGNPRVRVAEIHPRAESVLTVRTYDNQEWKVWKGWVCDKNVIAYGRIEHGSIAILYAVSPVIHEQLERVLSGMLDMQVYT
jgi:hypothetical protein